MQHMGRGLFDDVEEWEREGTGDAVAAEGDQYGIEQSQADDDEGVTSSRLLGMIEAQEFKCRLSGHPLTVDNAALDHIVPISKGGEHSMSNVQVLHAEVNRMKGTLDQSRFVALCRMVSEQALTGP